jgi:class 3 adenylate cyclase
LRPTARFCDACGQAVAPSPAAVPQSRVATSPVRAPNAPLPSSFGDGRYQVQRFLGEGAKKRVYLARDTRLDRDVAFALIKTEGLDQAGLTRVRREAQAMGRLGDHPHIVTVFDIGEEAGQPCIVSQYMAGGDVEALLQQAPQHRLPIREALRIADQVCRALQHAHGRGVIHRDLKPANVWLSQDGTAMLGDFGLAVALDRSRLTQAGMMVGTAVYMAPEQALGRPPDGRSDLYSLGAMLYEMVTGRPPFIGDDAVAIISQHINTPPVAPSWHNAEVPRSLEALILRLLAKAPEDRPADAAAVSAALAAITITASASAERVVHTEKDVLEPLVEGIFVGRRDEMAQLKGAVEDALSGRGRLLMLVGEPGIGKTRTAEELATYARLRNAQVLVGRCYEGEGAPAFWPWVQVIRAYVHDREPAALLAAMGSGAADIAQVVSQVRERLPGLPNPPPLDPEQARFRLFDSVTMFLKNSSQKQPLVVILDDLHWADKPSLLLLQFLAREMASARLLVLGTYRDVDVQRTHPLAEVVATLRRERLYERILLRGLPEDDVRTLLGAISGERDLPATFVSGISRETEGNPFFIEEILRHLVESGKISRREGRWISNATSVEELGLPEGIREVVGRRLARLSEPCARALTIAAVIGREFGFDVLERAGDVGGDQLLEALEEALEARLLTAVTHGTQRYAFTHALVRETLVEELSPTRRVRLHRRIGEVIEQFHASNLAPHFAELAHHFWQAAPGGDATKAIDYAIRAGERATGLLAYEEAVKHYERALQAVELQEPVDQQRRGELLLALGRSQQRAGDREAARATFTHAAELARAIESPDLLVQTALCFAGSRAGFVYFGVVDEPLIHLLEAALAASEASGDTAARARLLAILALELYRSTDTAERRAELCREAEAMARRVGDPLALADALQATQLALWPILAPDERLSHATEIIHLADSIGDAEILLAGRFLCLTNLLELGRIKEVDAELAIFDQLAQRSRQPFWRWNVAAIRTTRALLEGRFAEVEALAQEVLAQGERLSQDTTMMAFGSYMSLLRREQGRIDEMEPVILAIMAQHPELIGYRCALLFVYSEIGRQAEARSLFEQLGANDFADFPRDSLWLASVTLTAIACVFLRDAARAETLYQLLLPYADRNVMMDKAAICLGSAAMYLGALAGLAGRWDESQAHFEVALRFNAEMGARPWLAHTQHRYADMLLARAQPGDRERALELLAGALDIAQGLGMKRLLDDALASKLRAQGVAAADFKTSIDVVATRAQRERPDLRSHAAPDGTVTLMFSDIEGSTAITERLGDDRWLHLLRAHNAIVREQVAMHGGFEVKSQGDGFMLAFASARRALLCAVAMQRAFAAYSAQHSAEAIRVRIGLHTGEAIKEADDFFGKNVILAARIAAQAHGGEILASSLVKQLTESAGDVRFDAGREVTLKGLSGTYTVHTIRWAEAE